MRLIDADALYNFFLEMHKSGNTCTPQDVLNAITNAPTVQREGWKLVPIEPTDEMVDAMRIAGRENEKEFRHRDEGAKRIYQAMLTASPTDKE